MDAEATAGCGFEHQALFYESTDEFVAGTREFAQNGIESGERVLVAVPGPKIESMRSALNGSSDLVEFRDMTELGRNPGRIIAAVRDFADRCGERRCRFIGEPIWPGRSATEVVEATRHEALINLAFKNANAKLLCPYDAAGLDHHVLSDAERTHPELKRRGHSCASGRYADPVDLWKAEEWSLSAPALVPASHPISSSRLGKIRATTRRALQDAGLGEDRTADIVLAVDEAATNSLMHGADPASLRIWQDGAEIICEIADGGSISDPLAGRRRPDPDWPDGRGLWMINELCDLVELRPTRTGTVVRLHVSLPAVLECAEQPVPSACAASPRRRD